MKFLKTNLKSISAYTFIYLIIGILFLIWILFLDSHSWLVHQELDQEIETLETRKNNLLQSIEKDQKAIELLQNTDSLEKFARENFGHKREEETIFIIN